jgi:hypothetical protein
MFKVGMKVQAIRDMADGWGPEAGDICQVVEVHPDQGVFWITPLKSNGTLGSGIFWTSAADVQIIEETKMTLGEKLRATINTENAAKLEAERKAREAEVRRIAAARMSRQILVGRIKDIFIDKITRGETPIYKITSTDQRAWVNGCERNYNSVDCDIWDNFTKWLKSEDLRIKITEEHDGMGTADWIVIHAEPLPGAENDAD